MHEGDLRDFPAQQCLYSEIVQFDFIHTVCETGTSNQILVHTLKFEEFGTTSIFIIFQGSMLEGAPSFG